MSWNQFHSWTAGHLFWEFLEPNIAEERLQRIHREMGGVVRGFGHSTDFSQELFSAQLSPAQLSRLGYAEPFHQFRQR